MILYIHKRDEGDGYMLKNEKLLKKEIGELLEAAKIGFSIEKWESARDFAYSLNWCDSFKDFLKEKVRNCSAEKLLKILELTYNLGFENQSEITVKEIVTGSVNDAYSLFLTEGIIYYSKHLEDFTFEEFYESFNRGE